MAGIEIILLPYATGEGQSLVQRLICELEKPDWTRLRCAVAFAKQSGNYDQLLNALVAFATRGGLIQLTFGADAFAGDDRGSEFDAIKTLLESLQQQPGVTVCLYHEKGRTFHPKLYLFSNEVEERALLIVGSSNWSDGGFATNVEADLLIQLDLVNAEHNSCYQKVVDCFGQFWSQQ